MMNQRTFGIVLVAVVSIGAGIFLIARRSDAPGTDAPRTGTDAAKPGTRREERPAAAPDGRLVIRTIRAGKTEERVVQNPDQDTPFRFDDTKPLEPQLRSLLGAVCPWETENLKACRERSEAVISALLNILHDPSAGYNVREKGLGLLAHLGA